MVHMSCTHGEGFLCSTMNLDSAGISKENFGIYQLKFLDPRKSSKGLGNDMTMAYMSNGDTRSMATKPCHASFGCLYRKPSRAQLREYSHHYREHQMKCIQVSACDIFYFIFGTNWKSICKKKNP